MPYIDTTQGLMPSKDQKESALILQRIYKLQEQKSQIEQIWKALYSVTEKLSAIGNRINSIDHPDNKPQDPGARLSENGIPKSVSDGIVGELEGLIAHNDAIISEFNNRIWMGLIKNVEFIERHI